MIRILLATLVALGLALGYFVWRVDHLKGEKALLEQQKIEITVTANKNAEIIDLMKEQKKIDDKLAENLRKKNEEISRQTSKLMEKLSHEEDAPAAPVLRCAINERLCTGSNGSKRSTDNIPDGPR